MVGTGGLIDDRYRVEEVLGRGGMADVVRATDVVDGRPVAVKLLRSVEPADVRRFRAELEVLGRLDHPGVVRLSGAGSHDGAPYIVLELVDGSSLAAELAAGAMTLDRSLEVGQQVAEALAHAHHLGVVHRDVKPANVLIDPDGRVRLADFGIARLADRTRMTSTGLVIGTASYLAPEQVEGRSGPAADIYALGLVMLECLTGVRAYPGGSVQAAMARLHHPPAIPADLPTWLQDVLTGMTATEPSRRPSAAAVAEAFRSRSAEPVLAVTGVVGGAQEPTLVALVPADRTAVLPTTTADRPMAPRARARARRGRTLAMVAAAVVTLGILAWSLTAGDDHATAPPATAVPTPTVVTPVPSTQPPPPAGAEREQPNNGNGQGSDKDKDKGKGRGNG